MIEENRKEIGTLKSLGYRKREIASKYILYALLAALIGTVFGVVIGTLVLPKIVFHLLSDQYIFTNYQYHFIFWPIVLAVIVALIATLGASLLTLMKELRENATTLLMPKAPKAGKRVFLERIKPIWRRMSFNQKVTYRNLFRYKARMILTIVGIAGCTGLMLAGFGLQDSISAPVEKQFVALTKYQGIVTLNGTVQTEAEKVLTENPQVTAELPVYTDTVTFNLTGHSKQTATLYVSDQPEKFSQYVALKDEKTKAHISLSNQGALISQRLAKIYQVTKGDQLTFEDNDGKNYQIKVAGIVENYLGHNLYLSKEYYQEISGQTFTHNSYLIKTKKMTNSQEKKLAEDLLQTGEVLTTTYTSNQMAKQEAATENLGSIVLIFIVLSGTLAFVVLYNLTNINISERARELATIKVLGFFNQEVTMYIVRENIMFTLFGILFGFGIGNLLTRFILAMASSDMIVFPLVISWQGYVISAVMTVVFSVIVMGVTHFKLKQIDMIAALKSNE
nr:ABC transporter permease [Enterococcus alishanensis]